MSLRHTMHAWDRRYRDPIAPHAIGFLYAIPADKHGWWTLSAATRVWLAEPDTNGLPRLLFGLNAQVTTWPDQPVDVRQAIANRVDDTMTGGACYVGLGVTSLDTYSGTWEQACARGDQYHDIPATIRILLTDGTVIVCERRGVREFNAMTVHTSRALSFSALDAPYPYSSVTAEELKTDPAHSQVLTLMDQLHHTLWAVDNARLVASRVPADRVPTNCEARGGGAERRTTGWLRIPEQRT